ncbi:hypothetical protein HHO41_20135 [Bacillus sp. DNRA2]|uniref:DUF6241 domain-containing protein n=1 Tax=Bacillus sp. DNRA2 TaxID=2723053 RepID=UPI00145E7D5D|nr:DUF6241 domain-containing protein [Bacillus sp. DNRA2]NMD72564.1 hypothetical protein [Bacillus sp. DNRA2]
MKKYVTIALGILGAALIIGYVFIGKWGAETDSKPAVTKEEQSQAKQELNKSFETATPEGEMPKYETMSEQELLDEVHGMTHQKVLADEKWGSVEITKDKVEKLYKIANSKADSEIRSMLLEILEPWTKGDFSNAVEDHNRIWDYKDGNIGEATRLLTPVEEQEYIEKMFK